MAKSDTPDARVLAIDDDANILETYAAILEPHRILLTGAETLAAGLTLAASRPFDVCLLDRSIGHELGTEALPELKAQAPALRIIMVTAHHSTDAALEALRLGVDDYLVKPFSAEQLRIAIARQVEARKLATRVRVLEHEAGLDTADEVSSESAQMQDVLGMAKQVAKTGANVLILGESGTGKNVLARAIHRWSPRAEANFVTVNCPSLNAELLENELFGHRKGAFTGAVDSSEGRVAHADGGTLFLDEIGDFPLPLQPKLLRFIQDKQYERIGDPVSRLADVRLITATNRDLLTLSEAGEFRKDLFYRLNVMALTVPPLRERGEDILPIASRLLKKFAREYGCPAQELATESAQALRRYRWPGNVRELQNVIERAVILCPTPEVLPKHISLGASADAADTDAGRPAIGTNLSLEELERQHIAAVLDSSPTLDEAARTLGIDASTLYRKRKAYGLN